MEGVARDGVPQRQMTTSSAPGKAGRVSPYLRGCLLVLLSGLVLSVGVFCIRGATPGRVRKPGGASALENLRLDGRFDADRANVDVERNFRSEIALPA